MTPDPNRDPGEYYESRRARKRQGEHRRWDRRMQIGVVVLAAVAGIVAAMLGTHRSWEHTAPASPSVVHPASAGRP